MHAAYFEDLLFYSSPKPIILNNNFVFYNIYNFNGSFRPEYFCNVVADEMHCVSNTQFIQRLNLSDPNDSDCYEWDVSS